MVLAVGAGVRCLAPEAADPPAVSVLPAWAEDHLAADLQAAALLCPCQGPLELNSNALIRDGCGSLTSHRCVRPGSHSKDCNTSDSPLDWTKYSWIISLKLLQIIAYPP